MKIKSIISATLLAISASTVYAADLTPVLCPPVNDIRMTSVTSGMTMQSPVNENLYAVSTDKSSGNGPYYSGHQWQVGTLVIADSLAEASKKGTRQILYTLYSKNRIAEVHENAYVCFYGPAFVMAITGDQSQLTDALFKNS